MDLYLIPITVNDKGLVFEYRMEMHKTDRRTSYYRRNHKYIVDRPDLLIKAIQKTGAKLCGATHNRIIIEGNNRAKEFRWILNS